MVLSVFVGGFLCFLASMQPQFFFYATSATDILSSLIYPLHVGRILHDISLRETLLEQNATSASLYSWHDIVKDPTTDGTWASGINMLVLVGNSLAALFFAWYMDIVWPGQYGRPQRFIFLLTPRWWCPW